MYILRASEGGVWWWLAGDKLEEWAIGGRIGETDREAQPGSRARS